MLLQIVRFEIYENVTDFKHFTIPQMIYDIANGEYDLRVT